MEYSKEIQDALYKALRSVDSYCKGFFDSRPTAHFWTLHKDNQEALAEAEDNKGGINVDGKASS